jgi:hypothetical protein
VPGSTVNPSFEELPITRDEALLWLNDHLGKVLEAGVRISYNWVCSTKGILTYWTERNKDMVLGATGAMMAEGLTGVYEIGEIVFELTPMAVPWSYGIKQFPKHELIAHFESVELKFIPNEQPV